MSTDPRDRDPRDRPGDPSHRQDDGVPETWRGYLGGEAGAPSGDPDKTGAPGRRASDDPLSGAQRDWLERSLRGGEGADAGGPAAAPHGEERPLDERGLPRSRSEGVSFAGLIPFFLVLVVALGAFIYYSWQHMKPPPYDVSGFGPPDRTVEVAARDLFRDAVTGQLPADALLDDLTLARIGLKSKGAPFARTAASRARDAIERIRSSSHRAVSAEPQAVPESAAVMYLDYERTDLTTQQKRSDRLYFGRAEAGWRVIGFAP